MSLQDKQAAALRGATAAAHAAERRADTLRALEEERDGYSRQGRKDRAAEVQAHIDQLSSAPVGRQEPTPGAEPTPTPTPAPAPEQTPESTPEPAPAKKAAPAKAAPAKKAAPKAKALT